jgi:phosphatidate cytidylyltransferase
MLYQRILTAIPLAVFIFWVIFFQPTSVLFYVLLLVVLISGYEWARLCGIVNTVSRGVFALTLGVSVWAIQQYLADYIILLVYLSVMWWFSITLYLKFARPREPDSGLKPDRLIIAFLILPAAALAMQEAHSLYVGIDHQGPALLFYALLLVWIADSAAYFSGKKFGRNKLAPFISPGKTREGLYGALLATSIYSLLASYYFELETGRAILLVMLSVILTFISVSGDLYISLLKREAGVKDTGAILPGHGGMLDRIDSVLAVMPVFLAGLNWWIYPGVI